MCCAPVLSVATDACRTWLPFVPAPSQLLETIRCHCSLSGICMTGTSRSGFTHCFYLHSSLYCCFSQSIFSALLCHEMDFYHCNSQVQNKNAKCIEETFSILIMRKIILYNSDTRQHSCIHWNPEVKRLNVQTHLPRPCQQTPPAPASH